MRYQTSIPAIALLAWLSLYASLSARTIDPGYQIATWPSFRTAAVSYTFDDNCSNQLAVAVPMFNQFGFKLTLFTVTSWVTSWPALSAAAVQGHEIASHTVTHTVLNSLSASGQDTELKNSRSAITTNVTSQKCVTIAYPNCVEAIDTITAKYYIAARGCSGVVEAATPSQFLNISSIVCGNTGSYTSAQSLNSLASQAVSKGGWCVYLIHGIDSDGGYSPLSSTVLRQHIGHIDSSETTIWVATFGDAVRYIRERDSVSVKEAATGVASITFRVTHGMDTSIYKYPLTLKRTLPSGWTQVSISQNGRSIAATIGGQSVTFDVVPNGGDVIMTSGASQANAPCCATADAANYRAVSAQCLGASVVVSVFSEQRGPLAVSVFATDGTLLSSSSIVNNSFGSRRFSFPKRQLPSGVDIVRVSDGRNAWSRPVRIM